MSFSTTAALATLTKVAAALAANGTTVVDVGGTPVDLAEPWRRATMADLVEECSGERIEASMPVESARAALGRLGVVADTSWGSGRCLAEAFEAVAEHTLVSPTIVMDHPVETSPLARRHRDDPTLTERFEVIGGGIELANAYSELNDPVDQRERFEAEQKKREAGDAEAGSVDEDYLRALDTLESIGAEHLADRTYGTLSEGERKRVLIARSLMTDPELLLLDEPAAGLDLGGREELVARLADLAADPDSPALVLVTHHVEEIPPGFSHCLILAEGEVLAAGLLADTLTAENLSAAFGQSIAVDAIDGRYFARRVRSRAAHRRRA
jgi:ABC-type sugar transport system ATPase subunit